MNLTPLAVAVLALLAERPMHPYEMYSVMMHRQEGWLVKIRPGSLYHTVERLERDGLARVAGVEREGGRPERTRYALTDRGSVALEDWIRTTLADPGREYPRFPVALAEAHNLDRSTVIEQLSKHLSTLDSQIAGIEAMIEQVTREELAEALWFEADYLLVVRRAERDWVARTIERLNQKDLPWPK